MATLMSRSSIIARLRPVSCSIDRRIFAAASAGLTGRRPHRMTGLVPLYFTIVKYNIDARIAYRRPTTLNPTKRANMEVTRFFPLLGRLLIGLPFLMSGVGKLTTYVATTAYIGSVGFPPSPVRRGD